MECDTLESKIVRRTYSKQFFLKYLLKCYTLHYRYCSYNGTYCILLINPPFSRSTEKHWINYGNLLHSDIFHIQSAVFNITKSMKSVQCAKQILKQTENHASVPGMSNGFSIWKLKKTSLNTWHLSFYKS